MRRPEGPFRELAGYETLPILSAEHLRDLDRWVAAIATNARLTGRSGPSIPVQAWMLRALIRQARLGLGNALQQARPFAAKSAAAKRANAVRWSRVRARKRAALAESQNTTV